MINVFTSKRFVDDSDIIYDINSYFDNEVLTDITVNDLELGESELDYLLKAVGLYDKDKLNCFKSFSSLFKYVVAMKYCQLKKNNKVFHLGAMGDREIAVLLPYADKFMGKLLTVEVCLPMVNSEFEFIVNDDKIVSCGSKLFNYLLTYDLMEGSRYVHPVNSKELIVRGGYQLYNFEFKGNDNVILFDTDMEKDQFIDTLCVAFKNKGLGCRNLVLLNDETYSKYTELVAGIENTAPITRIIECDTLDCSKTLNDGFKGLTIYACIYSDYYQHKYDARLKNPVRVIRKSVGGDGYSVNCLRVDSKPFTPSKIDVQVLD